MNVLILIGVALICGTVGGLVFQKLKTPQVVGFIIIGVLLGKSFLNIFTEIDVEKFEYLVNFILGLIGFLIGSELKMSVFRKYGGSIYTILISEGILAFFFVSVVVTILTGKVYLGLLLGAIASATDPASTINVFWEYKSRGPLTTTVTAIVALDDGLALILYGLVSVFSKAMIAHEQFSIVSSLYMPLFEIFECFILGLTAALMLSKVVPHLKEKLVILALVWGGVALIAGLSIYLHIDLILSCMTFGTVMANMMPQKSKTILENIKENANPLYIFFFIIVGASLDIRIFLKMSVAILVVAYLLSRSFGKIFGAMLGGLLSRADKTVTKYSGLCLFTQGGVAMGLAMSINHNLSSMGDEGRLVGSTIINIVAATTFVVQLIGPFIVKLGIIKANEMFRNITENDIIESSKVKDFMRRDFSTIKETVTLDAIIEFIKEQESYHFPVINDQNELIGLISLGGLRAVFSEQQLNNIVLAKDVAVPAGKVLYQNQPLSEAFEIFDKREVHYLPVLESEKKSRIVGIVEYHPLVDAVHRKLFERQQNLDKSLLN